MFENSVKDKKIAIVDVISYEWVVSCLSSICGMGGIVVLDKELSMNELKSILIDTGCSCAIFPSELEDVFWQIRNDGVTELQVLINMDKDEENTEWDILSLKKLIDEGKNK